MLLGEKKSFHFEKHMIMHGLLDANTQYPYGFAIEALYIQDGMSEEVDTLLVREPCNRVVMKVHSMRFRMGSKRPAIGNSQSR